MDQSRNDKLQTLLQKLVIAFTSIPFNNILGLRLSEIDGEHVVMNFDMKEELVGNYMQNMLHGGVISSVLDMAGGMVTMAQAIAMYQDKTVDELITIVGNVSTINLTINYLRPGIGTQFIAKAHLVRAGKHITFTRMELFNNDETLIATANGTYVVKGV